MIDIKDLTDEKILYSAQWEEVEFEGIYEGKKMENQIYITATKVFIYRYFIEEKCFGYNSFPNSTIAHVVVPYLKNHSRGNFCVNLIGASGGSIISLQFPKTDEGKKFAEQTFAAITKYCIG